MRWHVTIGARTVVVELGPKGLLVDGEPHVADLETVADGPVRSLLLGNASYRIVARRSSERDTWDVQVGGRRFAATVMDERTRTIREMIGATAPAAGSKPVRAPMPGLVVRVEVAVGDVVEPGQGLVIVEAMKMENELRADVGGRVSAVRVAAGEAVSKDQVLVEFEAPRAPQDAQT